MHLLQQSFVGGAPLLACTLVLLTALFLTHSRAGVTASLAALLVLVIFMGPMRRFTRRVYKVLTLSILGAAMGIFFLSGQGWMDRLSATDLSRDYRAHLFDQTWDATLQAPYAGYGIGSYERTFVLFADERSVNAYKAHNDWLEMLFELGIPMAVVWFAVLGGLGLRCLVGFFRRKRDNIYPLVGFCACVLVGIHALADFSLQLPGVAIMFATLLGVGVAQSRSSLR